MKPSHAFLIVIGTLVFLMLGCFLFFGVFIGLITIDDVLKDIQRLYAHRFLAGSIGAFFMGVGYVAVKILIKSTYRDELFVIEGTHGRTSISIVAIEDLIKKTLRKYENIKRYRLKIRIQNKVLTVGINLILFMGKPASEVIEIIQNELQRKLKTFVGLKNEDRDISIKVSKVLEIKARASE